MTQKRLAKRPLTIANILAWADAYRELTGRWPKVASGRIQQDPFENWLNINQALMLGLRGLPGGSSLAQVLPEQRGVRNPEDTRPFTIRHRLFDTQLSDRMSAGGGKTWPPLLKNGFRRLRPATN